MTAAVDEVQMGRFAIPAACIRLGLCLLMAFVAAAASAQTAPSPALEAAGAHGAPDVDPLAEEGRRLLARHGCTGCHSLDGAAGPGPTFADRWGGLAVVRVGAESRPVPYDRAYLARAVAAPDAELAEGWSAGIMPPYDLDGATLDAMAAALAAAATAAPDPPPTGWDGLIAGLVIFVLGHFVLSAGPLRRPLVNRLGERGFQLAYSLVAAFGMYQLIVGLDATPYVELWPPLPWTQQVPLAVMPVAVSLWVFGFSTPSPTAAGQSARVSEPPKGIIAITRHPALWGFVLWGLAHLPPNGDLATVAFFGGFVVLALGGMWHIDRRRAARLGADWTAFAEQTSVVPFVALLRGRARLRFGRGDLVRLVVSLVVFVGILHTHHLLFGVPALR